MVDRRSQQKSILPIQTLVRVLAVAPRFRVTSDEVLRILHPCYSAGPADPAYIFTKQTLAPPRFDQCSSLGIANGVVRGNLIG